MPLLLHPIARTLLWMSRCQHLALFGATLQVAALPDVGDEQITVPTDPASLGVRLGQTVVVGADGVLGPNFNVGRGGILHVNGGTVGNDLEVVDGTVNISGGAVGNALFAFAGSEINVSGGTLGDNSVAYAGSEFNVAGGAVGKNFFAFGGSEVNISGGSIDERFRANADSLVNIYGGSIGGDSEARSDSVVNVSGGTFASDFLFASGSEVNIFGSEFLLDGAPIAGLTEGVPFHVTGMHSQLSGMLADGNQFAFDFTTSCGRDCLLGNISPGTKLSLVLSAPHVQGDYNRNGVVDAADYIVWRDALGTAASLLADGNGNGTIDDGDYIVWRAHFGQSLSGLAAHDISANAAVPEPITR